MPPQQLNFQNHCIFCLEVQPPGALLEISQRNVKNILDFQPVLNYLTGTDPTFDKGKEECLKKGLPIMGNLPPMCQQCYNWMGDLHQLHQVLIQTQSSIQKKTEMIRAKITMTYPGPLILPCRRQEFNNRMLSCGLPAEQFSRVCLFIHGLHDAIIGEGKKPVIYPSGPPPPPNQNTKAAGPTASSLSAQPRFPSSYNTTSTSTSQKPVSSSSIAAAASQSPSSSGSRKRKAPLETRPSPTKIIITPHLPHFASVGDDDDIKYENENSDEDEDGSFKHFFDEDDHDDESRDSEEEEDEKIFSPKKEYNHPSTSQRQTQIFSSSQSKRSNRKQQFSEIKEEGDQNFDMPESDKPKQRKKHSAHRTQPCDLCGKRYRHTDIEKHLKTHKVQDFITKCPNPECPRQFSCELKMKLHLKHQRLCKKGLPENFFIKKCEICPFEHCLLRPIRNHLALHEQELEKKNFPCPISDCSKSYALKLSLDFHIFYHNLRDPPSKQKCSICEEEIKVEEMEEHLKGLKHQILEPISCHMCKFIFPDRIVFLNHIFEHRDFDGVSCDICGDDKQEIKFETQTSLREHYFYTHEIKELESFKCEHCSAEFGRQTGLKIHISTMHPEIAKANKPPPKEFVMDEEWRLKNSLSKKLIFSCDLCTTSSSSLTNFKTAELLMTHKIEVHGADPFRCKTCSKTFMKEKILKAHIMKTHGAAKTVKTFTCMVEGCGKIFTNSGSWSSHRRQAHISQEDRPIKCQFCFKGFWTLADVTLHQNTVHLGIRDSVCHICGESFTSESTLKRHNLIHTGERPFECPLCGQKFRHKEVMKKHISSHEEKGDNFKPNGPMKQIRKRVQPKKN